MLLFTEFMLTFKIHLGRIELFIRTYILIWPKVISVPTVLVSCGYCIKLLLQVCWLKTTEIYSPLTVMEARSPMSRCHGALLPLKTVGENLVFASLGFCWLRIVPWPVAVLFQSLPPRPHCLLLSCICSPSVLQNDTCD